MSGAIAAEAREIVRQAVGDAAGLTIKAQLRQATMNLGYGADEWRLREALYGRAGSWSAAAVDDLRRRHSAWREREAARATAGQIPDGNDTAADRHAMARRLDAIRTALAEVQRQVDKLSAEVEQP